MARSSRLAMAVDLPEVVAEALPTLPSRTLAPGEDRLLSVEGVAAVLDLSISTIYRMVSAGKFPRPMPIDGGTPPQGSQRHPRYRWSANEVQEWIATRLAERSA